MRKTPKHKGIWESLVGVEVIATQPIYTKEELEVIVAKHPSNLVPTGRDTALFAWQYARAKHDWAEADRIRDLVYELNDRWILVYTDGKTELKNISSWDFTYPPRNGQPRYELHEIMKVSQWNPDSYASTRSTANLRGRGSKKWQKV